MAMQMQMARLPAGSGHRRVGIHQAPQRWTACCAQAGDSSASSSEQAQSRGPNGINVGGYRPTSPAGWQMMKETMMEAGVKVLNPQEVVFAQERGTVLIDVRPTADYDAGHVPGAVNVQFYRPIEGWSPYQIARRIGYAAFGVLNGTEVNPNFLAEVSAVVPNKQQGVILYCSQGGSLEPVEGSSSRKGFQTRSLVAAHELVLTKEYGSIAVMKGGFREWAKQERPVMVMEEVQ